MIYKKKNGKKIITIASVVATVLMIVAVIFVVKAVGNNRAYRIISVVEVSGRVSVVKDGMEYKAYQGMLLQEGHELVTSADSYARLLLDDDKYIKVEAGSKVVFETLGIFGSGKTKIRLERGSLTSEIVKPLQEDETFVINTPNAVLAVRGTFFRVELGVQKNGDIMTDVMTYGGSIASQRILPSGETVNEDVLIDAGFKAAINMTTEDTYYVVEAENGDIVIVEPSDDIVDGEPVVLASMPITVNDIADEDLIDIYFAAENGHELFVTAEEVKADIEERAIDIEEYVPVYEKAEEVKALQEDKKTASNYLSAAVIANDSKPLAREEEYLQEGVDKGTIEDIGDSSGLIDNVHVHKEKKTIIDATCILPGSVTVTCIDCEEVISVTEIAVLGHDYATEFTIDEVASCITEGSKSKHCLRCDAKGEVTTIEVTEHEYKAWNEILAASCKIAGARERKCEYCGYTEQEEIKAQGHSYSDEFVISTAATCTTAGSKYKYCLRCNVKGEVLTVEPTGHTYAEWAETLAAGCETEGEKTRSCETCGYVETDVIEAKGHLYKEWKVAFKPGCDVKGYRMRSCEICNRSDAETIDALGHDYAEEFTVDTPATCIKAGSKSKHCTRCDAKSEVTEIKANGVHVYTEWVDVFTADCVWGGTKVRDCKICEYRERVTIEPLGHDYAEEFMIDTPATCTTPGSKSKHCQRCDAKSEVTEIATTGEHKYTEWEEITAADCKNDGKKTRYCEICESKEEMVVPALGHSYSEEFTIDVPATCTSAGSKSKRCTVCGIMNERAEIPATGHKRADLYVAGTQTENGYYRLYCSTCNMTLADDELLSIPLNFPDAAFAAYIADTFDKDGYNSLSMYERAEMTAVSSLDITQIESTYGTISSLEGIEHFMGLESLDCSGNTSISNLNLSQNSMLRELDISGCTGITSMAMSSMGSLEMFDCSGSGLGSLDISYNANLQSINMTNCMNLTEFRCDYGAYTGTLDFTGCTSIEIVSVIKGWGGTGVSGLVFSGNPSLAILDITDCTAITSIDLSPLENLSYFYCSGSGITSLDISSNEVLMHLECNNTAITTLDISNNIYLEELYAENTQIVSFDISGRDSLSYNVLRMVSLANCTSLQSVNCSNNSCLTDLTLSGCTSLLSNGGLDLTNCTSLLLVNLTGAASGNSFIDVNASGTSFTTDIFINDGGLQVNLIY